MGVVDLGVAPDGTEVALKRLSLHGTPEEIARARARIRREAEVLGSLDHPGIVRLLELVDDGDDVVLVMPYLPGGSLHDRVAAHGPLDPAEVEVLADRLLDALAAAHRQGVVHRDIKPENVLFTAAGDPRLVDFGVARATDHTAGLTATAMVVGTPAFMAPEQARGEPAGAAADIFSLGATVLFALTGEGPYGPPRLRSPGADAPGRPGPGRAAAPRPDPGPARRCSPPRWSARPPSDRRPPACAAARRAPARSPSWPMPCGATACWSPLGAAMLVLLVAGVAGAAALDPGATRSGWGGGHGHGADHRPVRPAPLPPVRS